MTLHDGLLTGILCIFAYKEMHSDAILRDFVKTNADFKWQILFGFCMRYGVITSRFLTSFGTQNNGLSYHDQI